jgi:peptidoglycan hydrolase-like protein with peptidoglycan-binding domain
MSRSSLAASPRAVWRAAESKGNVKQIQETLKKEGFDSGPADGVMGQKTSDALKQSNRKKNLKAPLILFQHRHQHMFAPVEAYFLDAL